MNKFDHCDTVKEIFSFFLTLQCTKLHSLTELIHPAETDIV